MARHDDETGYETGYEMSMRNQYSSNDKVCSNQFLFNV